MPCDSCPSFDEQRYLDLAPDVVWRGQDYRAGGTLVLGESWYGHDEYLTQAIDAWCESARGATADRTFARIAWTINASTTAARDRDRRRAAWDGIAFFNFAGNVGCDIAHRPKAMHLNRGAALLPAMLRRLQPARVWILGKGQAEYSAPVASEAGIRCSVSAHPTSFGLRNAALAASWQALHALP